MSAVGLSRAASSSPPAEAHQFGAILGGDRIGLAHGESRGHGAIEDVVTEQVAHPVDGILEDGEIAQRASGTCGSAPRSTVGNASGRSYKQLKIPCILSLSEGAAALCVR